MTEDYYYSVRGQQHGPVPLTTLEGLVATGILTPTDYVFPTRTAAWIPVGRAP